MSAVNSPITVPFAGFEGGVFSGTDKFPIVVSFVDPAPPPPSFLDKLNSLQIGISFAQGNEPRKGEIVGRIAASFLAAVRKFNGTEGQYLLVPYVAGASVKTLTMREMRGYEVSNIEPATWRFTRGNVDYAPRSASETSTGIPEPSHDDYDLALVAQQPPAPYYVNKRTINDIYETVFQPTVSELFGHIQLASYLNAAQTLQPRQVTASGVSVVINLGDTITINHPRLSVFAQLFFVVRVVTDRLTGLRDITAMRIQ